MRVILVGPAAERAKLRAELGTAVEIVGEFRRVLEARRAELDADALIVSNRSDTGPTLQQPLTPRELEVLELVGEGLPNKAIAARLGISDQTVKFHVASICGKLDAVNRTDAVRRAIHLGILTI